MDESPLPPRTPQRSRYSSYQSDYETAAEDSDGSLYYSLLDEDEKENDTDDKGSREVTPRNDLSRRRTLLQKFIQNSLNLTPRNEHNKRVSFNFNPYQSTSIDSPTAAVRGGIGSQETSFENGIEDTKRLKNEESTILPTSSSSTEEISEMLGPLNSPMTNIGNVSGDGEEDLNGTIIAAASNAIETICEDSEEAKQEAIGKAYVGEAAVPSATTVFINLETTSVPCGPQTFGPSAFGLSNLPIPKKVSIVNLANPPAAATKRSNIPSYKRLSLFHSQSTENYGFSRPNGKSGIPKISLMLARNNSMMQPSVLPPSSSQVKCDYCDKTFAKQSILNGHLLEKCEKIPPARHRQLSRQLSCPH